MAKAKPKVERTITEAEILRACAGGRKVTTREIFSTLGIPSATRKGPNGRYFGPTDPVLTNQAVYLLSCMVSTGKLKWNQNKRGAGTPILYWI